MLNELRKGFTPPYRLDRTEHGGGLILFITEDIPSKLLPNVNPGNVENIVVEINLRSKKWLLSGSYNPNVGLIQNRTVSLSKNLHFYLQKNILVQVTLMLTGLIVIWKNFVHLTILRT